MGNNKTYIVIAYQYFSQVHLLDWMFAYAIESVVMNLIYRLDLANWLPGDAKMTEDGDRDRIIHVLFNHPFNRSNLSIETDLQRTTVSFGQEWIDVQVWQRLTNVLVMSFFLIIFLVTYFNFYLLFLIDCVLPFQENKEEAFVECNFTFSTKKRTLLEEK